LVVNPALENRLEDKDDDVIFEDLCLFAVYGGFSGIQVSELTE
jgi:hypothetical protein